MRVVWWPGLVQHVDREVPWVQEKETIMNHRELDCLIIGFSVGALAFLWLGYKLRQRVERWHARREQRAHQRVLGRQVRQSSKHIPFGNLNDPLGLHKMTGRTAGDIAARAEQDARQVMQKQKITNTNVHWIPIMSRKRLLKVTQLTELEAEKLTEELQDIMPAAVSYDQVKAVAMTGHSSREDAIACLTGAGYKRSTAEAMLDACTPLERASGLEHWVATALRRAVTKP
jgi:hypothetical protein